MGLVSVTFQGRMASFVPFIAKTEYSLKSRMMVRTEKVRESKKYSKWQAWGHILQIYLDCSYLDSKFSPAFTNLDQNGIHQHS